ncbi:MAG TPA: transcriptional regulator [Naasia sp.]|jgi:hypothetical protein
MSDAPAVRRRFGLDAADVEEELLDQRALGRVTWSAFGDTAGWTLSERGKSRNEELLAAELDGVTDLRHTVSALYERFLPLNGDLRTAITNWQIRPTDGEPYAENDHRDAPWDAAVLADLRRVVRSATPILAELEAALPRTAGYAGRLGLALAQATEGDRERVAGLGIDSLHTVWFELHEDLLATLGLQR